MDHQIRPFNPKYEPIWPYVLYLVCAVQFVINVYMGVTIDGSRARILKLESRVANLESLLSPDVP